MCDRRSTNAFTNDAVGDRLGGSERSTWRKPEKNFIHVEYNARAEVDGNALFGVKSISRSTKFGRGNDSDCPGFRSCRRVSIPSYTSASHVIATSLDVMTTTMTMTIGLLYLRHVVAGVDAGAFRIDPAQLALVETDTR